MFHNRDCSNIAICNERYIAQDSNMGTDCAMESTTLDLVADDEPKSYRIADVDVAGPD